ncbi:MAG TPA: hypothetical protein VKP52_14350 [Pseudolabrys sp.]|nr:hypothetical protein [Pseudolabrys sp.]
MSQRTIGRCAVTGWPQAQGDQTPGQIARHRLVKAAEDVDPRQAA